MSVLMQIRNATKRFGEQVLLDNAEVTITGDVKVGFVGRNGAGKSTLLRCLLGEEELDGGEVVHHPRLSVGYLRQHDPFVPGESALEFLMRDSNQPDWKCGEVAGQFELKGAYLEGPVSKLSGGWQTRVKLAALLLHEPNLLLLDEPTNFLDLRTQILLEHFLRGFREAALIVSHDRAFLAATCTHTLELAHGKLTMYPGKIDSFLEYQRERREHDERSNAAVLAKRKQLEEFIAKNKARASTATRARSKSKMLERLETIDIEADAPTASIKAPEVEQRKGPALRCKDVSIGYPDRTIATEIGLEIDHGQRAAIVGDNGQGKTTFLRTIVESLEPIAGEVKWGFGCNIGVYAQHVYTTLPDKHTVMDFLEDRARPGTKTQQILDVAAALLFRGEHVKKKIGVLSGGERARLCLAGLLLGDYNVLILDEPGNHLDVETVEALADALCAYKGTVIFTSHDRHFMKRIATCIVEVRDGRVVNYRGDYEAYLYAVNKEIDDGERAAGRGNSAAPSKKAASPVSASGGNKLATKAAPEPVIDERKLRKEMSAIERVIARLDSEKKAIDAKLQTCTDAKEAMKLHEELQLKTAELAREEERWLAVQQQLGDAAWE